MSAELQVENTDLGLALQFSEQHHNKWKYCEEHGKWYRWDNTRWKKDNVLTVFDDAREICRRQALIISSYLASQKDKKEKPPVYGEPNVIMAAKTIAAVEKLARYDRRHAVESDDLDRDDWLLATPTGTVDLKTGKMRENRQKDLISKACSVSPSSQTPTLWLAFLERIFGGDKELIDYIQRLTGYALTGSTREQILAFFYGTGGNGKSVFLNVLRGILSEFTAVASAATFEDSKYTRHSAEIAHFRGARVVIAQETEEGSKWAEAKIKRLTGGDKVTAQFMRKDYFEFVPKFKLFIAGNHRPQLQNIDEAIRRRLHLIPFAVTIPEAERDSDLPAKLKEEWPMILGWAIKGCIDWQEGGLRPPAAVIAATNDYLAAEDTIAEWISGAVIIKKGASEEAMALFASWSNFADLNGYAKGSSKSLVQALEARGYTRRLHPTTRRSIVDGLSLRPLSVLD
ncbi:Phage/plasmid primase, P4 family (fragment) [Rhodospirillaceae bacterium LM-1]